MTINVFYNVKRVKIMNCVGRTMPGHIPYWVISCVHRLPWYNCWWLECKYIDNIANCFLWAYLLRYLFHGCHWYHSKCDGFNTYKWCYIVNVINWLWLWIWTNTSLGELLPIVPWNRNWKVAKRGQAGPRGAKQDNCHGW